MESDIDLDRLTKLLGLLGSEYAGERAAAAMKAHKLLRLSGMTWAEIIKPRHPFPAPLRRRTTPSRSEPLDHADAAEQCLDAGVRLTPWEARFLESLASFGRLSDRQEMVLTRICRKAGVWWP